MHTIGEMLCYYAAIKMPLPGESAAEAYGYE